MILLGEPYLRVTDSTPLEFAKHAAGYPDLYPDVDMKFAYTCTKTGQNPDIHAEASCLDINRRIFENLIR